MHVPLGDTYEFKFTTRTTTGAPTTLAGTPVISVYEENNLVQITAGITLTVDYDSVTGMNHVAVVATTGNGYEIGKYYNAVITTGTVGGTSVVGEVVGHFRMMPAEDAGAGIPDINLVSWLDTAAATPTVAGVPEVDITHFGGSAGTFSSGRPETNTTHWAGTATTLSATTTKPEVDLYSISDDATAANTLELQFDGTGLSGDTYPATQAQVSGISVASAAQSVRVKPAPNGFVLTTGSEVNDEDSTVALDGVRHELTDSAGTLDCYYKFDIEPGAVPVSLTIKAVVNGGNDTFGIYANIGSSSVPSWSQRLSITGTGTTTNDIYTVDLYSSDTLTDLITEVWIRIYGTALTTSSFDIDQMFISRSFNYQYSGYDNGAVWINTTGGTAGTTLGYNGIASRPVDTLADAVTIGNLLSLSRFEISNSSSITLSSTTSNKILAGRGWTLALGGQDITNTHILDAKVSGIGTGADVEFHDSPLTNVTLPDGSFHNCAVIGTFTCSAAGTYHFHQSHSGDGTTPTIDLGAAVGNTVLLMHNWKGAFLVDNLGATGTDEINLAGDGEITLNASCVGGTLNIQGNWKVTNNGSGITINYDDNTANIASILVDTGTTLPATLGTPAGADLATDIASIQTDTNDLQTQIGTAGSGLTDLGGMSIAMKAEVNAEMLDVLQTDTFAELAAIPAATSSIKDKLTFVFMLARNQLEQTSTTATLRRDDTTTPVGTATVSDDGTTATKGEWA